MAQLTIENPTDESVYCGDLYTSIRPHESVVTTRYASDLPRMSKLQALIRAGKLVVSVQLSADEQASGLAIGFETPPAPAG